MSSDYGKTWKSVKGNLPESVANILIQDPVNPDLLYCGLDNGTYVSLDKGITWNFFTPLLNVASYDMMVHPRDNELVVGTHGRSVFVADVKPLQALKQNGQEKAVVSFAPESIRFNDQWGEKRFPWSEAFTPEVLSLYYVGKASPEVSVQIMDENNNVVATRKTTGSAGFNKFKWDVKVDAVTSMSKKDKTKPTPTSTVPPSRYAQKGKYKLKFVNGAENSEVPLEIK